MSREPRAPARVLDTPITFLKGVGERRAEAFRRLGVLNARDLLFHIPHRYEDASTVRTINSLRIGEDASVIGTVISKGVLPTRKGLRIFQAVVQDPSGLIEVSWPGQPFLDRSIDKGDVLLLSGTVRFYHGRQLMPREFVNLGAEDSGTAEGRVLAVYPATEGLSFKQIRAVIEKHLDTLLPAVEEFLSAELLHQTGLPGIQEALRRVHRPSSVDEALSGRARLAFDELLCVHLLQRRANAIARQARHGITFVNRRDLTSKLKAALPWELTGAQVRATREIVADMTSPLRMHRLLQGDVGSGKTIVALFACALPSRTATRPPSWRPPNCSPSSTCAPSRASWHRSASSRCSWWARCRPRRAARRPRAWRRTGPCWWWARTRWCRRGPCSPSSAWR